MAMPGWMASLTVPHGAPSSARAENEGSGTAIGLRSPRDRIWTSWTDATRTAEVRRLLPAGYNDFGDVEAFRWRTDPDAKARRHSPGEDEPGRDGTEREQGGEFPLRRGGGTDDPFEHTGLFYSGMDEFLAGTVPFIEDALAAGEPVAVAVPKPNLDAIEDALGDKAEQVLLVNMAEAGANPGRIIPGVKGAFADQHPGRHVHIVGEPIWPGRTDYEYPACAQHEALINFAFTGRRATILCPYDLDRLDDRAIADARATHPTLVDRDGYRDSADFDPERIVTEYNRPLDRLPSTAIERSVEPDTLENARWFVTSYGRKAGLSAHRLIDLEIAVTELLLNSIDHGGGSGTLRVWADDEELVCEVCDQGHITDPLAGRRPVGSDLNKGRGLLLVNRVVDFLRTYTSRFGTTMRFHLRLHDAPGHHG